MIAPLQDRDSARARNRPRPARRSRLVFIVCLALSGACLAHDDEPLRESVGGELGHVRFENTGSRAAQKPFLRGLLLLHSFEYSAARNAFEEAQRADPRFAMAVWGEALTYNHTLWFEQDTAAARAAMAKLGSTPEERIAKGGDARERAYLASLEKLYGTGDKAARNVAYHEALAALSRQYPDDLDARSLYALSFLALTPTRNVSNYMRAAAEAEAVYEIDRNHPGTLHYLIHSYDDPVHAPLGLRAARLYAKVAPAAAHAQHMTSHIFFALGLWDDAIGSNIASLRVSRAEGNPGYHALLWLEYAYLQKNERAPAAELLASVEADVARAPTKENRLRLAFARATWLVETRGAAPASAAEAVDSTGVTSIGGFAAHDFARGVIAAERGQLGVADSALAALRQRTGAARVVPAGENASWVDVLNPTELQQSRALVDALDGAIRFRRGEHAAGIAAVERAIAATKSLEFEYGPPWSAKPLDELLGELLLASGKPAEAAAAFRQELATYPNRRLALDGLAACGAAP